MPSSSHGSPRTEHRLTVHASSLEDMLGLYERFIEGRFLDAHDVVDVLEVGGASVNGSYRAIFDDPRIRYRAADLEDAGSDAPIEIRMSDAYHIPVPDASVDVVVAGQMLEHCERFWVAFEEMLRVLRPDGYLFLIAPSSGPMHRYPVDCYRFLPDAWAALARYGGCHLVEAWLDERGPWRNSVGVFRHTVATDEVPGDDAAGDARPPVRRLATIDGVGPPSRDVGDGTPEEEARAGTSSYLEVLARIHRELRPEQYLEVGVRSGASLRLALGPAIGVDPDPEVAIELPSSARIVRSTSDDVFRAGPDVLSRPVDLAFVDGLHLFEFALRDLMHIERLAVPWGLLVVDDVLPNHPLQASRERRTRVWTGDVWKLHACLAEQRPDLVLIPLDTEPTGLLLVCGLDPSHRGLWDAYDTIVRHAVLAMGEPPASVIGRVGAWAPDDARLGDVLAILRDARDGRIPPAGIRGALAQATR